MTVWSRNLLFLPCLLWFFIGLVRLTRYEIGRGGGPTELHSRSPSLSLLLAMQRFENRRWGLNPHVDTHFGELSTPSTTVLIQDRKKDPVKIVLDCSPDKRVSHYGLNGRAANLLPVISHTFRSTRKLDSKLFWAEESRTSEPEILEKVFEIAKKEPDVKNHVPVMVYHHKFSDSSTTMIRLRLRLPNPKKGPFC